MRTAIIHRRIFAVAVMYMMPVGAGASAQTPPVPSAPVVTAATGTPTLCLLSVTVRDLDDTHTRYAMSFSSLARQRASGTIALWAGARRFDVPFHDAVSRVLDSRDRTIPPAAGKCW